MNRKKKKDLSTLSADANHYTSNDLTFVIGCLNEAIFTLNTSAAAASRWFENEALKYSNALYNFMCICASCLLAKLIGFTLNYYHLDAIRYN